MGFDGRGTEPLRARIQRRRAASECNRGGGARRGRSADASCPCAPDGEIICLPPPTSGRKSLAPATADHAESGGSHRAHDPLGPERRSPARSLMTRPERPRGDGAPRPGGGSPPETRDEAVARLESDLEKLRALLREHMIQREAVEEELRASGEQY